MRGGRGCQAERAVIGLGRLREPALIAEREAEVVVACTILGLECHGALAGRDRLGEPTPPALGHTEVPPGLDEVRARREAAPEEFRRPFQRAGLEFQETQEVERVRLLRPLREHRAVEPGRLVPTPGPVMGERAREPVPRRLAALSARRFLGHAASWSAAPLAREGRAFSTAAAPALDRPTCRRYDSWREGARMAKGVDWRSRAFWLRVGWITTFVWLVYVYETTGGETSHPLWNYIFIVPLAGWFGVMIVGRILRGRARPGPPAAPGREEP